MRKAIKIVPLLAIGFFAATSNKVLATPSSYELWSGDASGEIMYINGNGDTSYFHPFSPWYARVDYLGPYADTVNGHWCANEHPGGDSIWGHLWGRRNKTTGAIYNGGWDCHYGLLGSVWGHWGGTWPRLTTAGDSADVADGWWTCLGGGSGGGSMKGKGHGIP